MTSDELARIAQRIILMFVNNNLTYGETMAVIKTLEDIANEQLKNLDKELN